MSKVERNVRYREETLEKIEYLAGKLGIYEAEVFRRLVTSSESVDQLYARWLRIENEINQLSDRRKRKLEERHDNLVERLYDLSEAEKHLLEEIQRELRRREENEAVPA
jgi:predicted transcriptional regulator